VICNAEGMSEDCELLELMGAEKLEMGLRLQFSVKEYEIVCIRNLEEENCYEWMRESRGS